MIQTVVKRDGRVVGYNDEKIKAAIRKAMLQTEMGEDEALIHKITDRISMTGNERMTVEEIQDMVELELMKSPARRWPSDTSLIVTNETLRVVPRHGICFWRLSRQRATT